MCVPTAHGSTRRRPDPAEPTLVGRWRCTSGRTRRSRWRWSGSACYLRDPRGFHDARPTPGQLFPYGAVHIADVSNPPGAMRELNRFHVPHLPHDVVRERLRLRLDLRARRQPAHPARLGGDGRCSPPTSATRTPSPARTHRHRSQRRDDRLRPRRAGRRAGVAWVSGAGGVRGYWTRGPIATWSRASRRTPRLRPDARTPGTARQGVRDDFAVHAQRLARLRPAGADPPARARKEHESRRLVKCRPWWRSKRCMSASMPTATLYGPPAGGTTT